VRVNKTFLKWLEKWAVADWDVWTVYRKAFKTQQFYFTQKIYIAQEKVKTFKETVSFHLALNHSNYLNQMYFHIFYIPALLAGHLTSLIMHARGHYGKIQPRVLANHSARYMFTSSSHITIISYKKGRSLKETLVRTKLWERLKHERGSRAGLSWSPPFYTVDIPVGCIWPWIPIKMPIFAGPRRIVTTRKSDFNNSDAGF